MIDLARETTPRTTRVVTAVYRSTSIIKVPDRFMAIIAVVVVMASQPEASTEKSRTGRVTLDLRRRLLANLNRVVSKYETLPLGILGMIQLQIRL